MRISDWSSDVCSSDLVPYDLERQLHEFHAPARPLSEAESARVEALSAENDQLVEQLEGELTDGTAEAEVANDRLDEIERELESRSEEHPSELQSLMRRSYAVFCFTKKNTTLSK